MKSHDLKWRLEVLAGCSWLGEAQPEALKEFAAAARYRRYVNGELVAARGQPPEGIAVVVSGAIRIASIAPDGREIVYSLVHRGGVWGIVAAIDGKGATHDTHAHGETEALLVPRKAFLKVLERHPHTYGLISRMLCHRLRKAHGLVDEFALAPLRERLARRLCTLAIGASDASNADTVRLRFTQSDIAVMLSASRPTVNRELKRLQQEGLIDVSYGAVTVKRLSGLRDLCEDKEIFSY